jgi:hypothetical protein
MFGVSQRHDDEYDIGFGRETNELDVYHRGRAGKGKKWWRCCFERGADGSILDLADERRERE